MGQWSRGCNCHGAELTVRAYHVVANVKPIMKDFRGTEELSFFFPIDIESSFRLMLMVETEKGGEFACTRSLSLDVYVL